MRDVDPNGTHLQPDGYNPASDNYPFGTIEQPNLSNADLERIAIREKKAKEHLAELRALDRERAIDAATHEEWVKQKRKEEVEAKNQERRAYFKKEEGDREHLKAYLAALDRYEQKSKFYRLFHKSPARMDFDAMETSELNSLYQDNKGKGGKK